jgi:uncharacterized protein (DUF1778 family)
LRSRTTRAHHGKKTKTTKTDAAAITLGTGNVFADLGYADAQERQTKQNQRLLLLDADHYDTLVRLLDNPPAPGPKLRALLRRVPAWRK